MTYTSTEDTEDMRLVSKRRKDMAAWAVENFKTWPKPHELTDVDRNLRGKPRGSARGSSEQAGTACGATSVASGQLACEVQQGQPHQPLPTAMLSGG